MQVLPAEKLAADGTALRSYSPQDIADIGFAATPPPTVQTGSSYILASQTTIASSSAPTPPRSP